MSKLARLAVVAAVVCLLGAGFSAVQGAQKPLSGPALETPEPVLAAALHCPPSLRGLERDPILLVHGTAVHGAEGWSWNYGVALPNAGFAACFVELPDHALRDIQESTEYVVYAIRTVSQMSGRRVAVIGHSQGGLEPRWALRWWPDLRELVSDSISLASTHHGTTLIDAAALCARGCAPAIFQQRSESQFLAALNAGGETFAPVDYTAIYTALDAIVTPPATASSLRPSAGARVTNVQLQDICPDNAANHLTIVTDALAYAVVLDALLYDGPADPARIARAVCAQQVMPGIGPTTAEEVAPWIAAAFEPATPRIARYPTVPEEPPLKPYAR